MAEAISCPGCGAPISETSILALAPVCKHCGSVIVTLGGSLGITAAYGVSDKGITISRAQADLQTLRDYLRNYRGMNLACKEQLEWGPERYAKLPPKPQFPPEPEEREVGKLPEFGAAFASSLGLLIIVFPVCIVSRILGLFVPDIVYFDEGLRPAEMRPAHENEITFNRIVVGPGKMLPWLPFAVSALPLAIYLLKVIYIGAGNLTVKTSNFKRRREYNARVERIQREFNELVAKATNEAEPLKAAEDYRLKVRIRELEGLIKTVAEKEISVASILRTLG